MDHLCIEALELNYSVFIVAGLFILYHLVLKVLFYKPFFRMLEQREAQTEGRLREASHHDEKRDALLGKYEESVRKARQEGFQLTEQARRQGLDERQRQVSALQAELQQSVAGARDTVRQGADETRRRMEGEIADFARIAAGRILYREIAS